VLSWFIIASGPSLAREDVESLRGQRVLVINDNYLLAPWAEALYACDGHWWEWHAERAELKAFRGRKITQDEEAAKRYGLEYIESIDAPGLSSNPQLICQGQNSGIQAINLAFHLGARRIVLLGYDMQETGGRKHWHAGHPNGPATRFQMLVRLFDQVADDAQCMGIKIINCSRATALRCFPRVPLSSLLGELDVGPAGSIARPPRVAMLFN
jgi:hypothetical protein